MRALDPALPLIRHVHPVIFDQAEHGIGRAADEIDQAPAALGTEFFLQLVRIVFQPRNHLAAIAPRTAPAGLMRFQHHDARAALGEMQRGRQARIARADHDDVGRDAAFERGCRRGCWRGRRP